MANTYYVSNVANNSYGLGVDSNTTTQAKSQSTPWLTIAHAVATAASGDTIIVNPSGTPYVENSGSNYLNITQSVTIQTDPALVASQGKIVLRSNAATRIANINASNITLNNLILDANSTSGASGLTVQSITGLQVLNCDVKNVPSSGIVFSFFAANASATFDKCTCLSTNGNGTDYFITLGASGLSITVKGCTVSGINAFIFPNGNNNQTLIRTMASADGTRNTVSSCTYGIRLPGATVSTLDIEAIDFSSIGNPAIWDNNLTTAIVTIATITSCTCSGSNSFIGTNGTWSGSIFGNSTSTTGSFLQSSGIGLSSMLIYGNVISQTGAVKEPFLISAGGSGIKVYNNTITTDITSHVIVIGNDGQSIPVKNNESITTSIPLGDSSGDTYFYQPFTTVASTALPNTQIPSSVQFSMKKTGSPTGSVTAYLYSNNAGVPGTLVATSEFTLSAANLTTSSQFIEFWFPSHPVLSYGTQYHAVLKYTGTNDDTNYVSLDAGTTFSSKGGYSTDGVSWGAAGSKASIFNICYLAFEITAPEIHDNIIINNVASTVIVHSCFMGGTTGGKIYRNQVYNGSLCLIFKLADGSGTYPLLCYDNVVQATNGASGTMYDKGSRSAQFYHNTIINASQNGASACVLSSDFTTGNYNAQASQNAIVKNNIFYRSAPTLGPIYQLGITGTAQPTLINPTIDNNLIYIGSNTLSLADSRSGSTVNYTTFAQVQSLGFDTHGDSADPLLTNEVSPTSPVSFRPLYNSPANSMGANLQSTIPNDYFGVAFSTTPIVGALNLLKRTTAGARLSTGIRTITSSRTTASLRAKI